MGIIARARTRVVTIAFFGENYNIYNAHKRGMKMSKKKKPSFTKENFEKARLMFTEGSKYSVRASKLLRGKDYSGSIEASQHSVEFFVKSLFIISGLRPPKTHDPGEHIDIIVREFQKINPSTFDKAQVDPIGRLKYLSKKFSSLHIESMYGHNDVPASRLFTEEDAQYYFSLAFEIEFLCLLINFTFGYHFEFIPEEGRRFLERYASRLFSKNEEG